MRWANTIWRNNYDCHKNKPRNYRVQGEVLFRIIPPPAGLLCCGCDAGDCDLLCLSALAADGYAGRFLYRHGGGAAFFGVGLYPP